MSEYLKSIIDDYYSIFENNITNSDFIFKITNIYEAAVQETFHKYDNIEFVNDIPVILDANDEKLDDMLYILKIYELISQTYGISKAFQHMLKKEYKEAMQYVYLFKDSEFEVFSKILDVVFKDLECDL